MRSWLVISVLFLSLSIARTAGAQQQEKNQDENQPSEDQSEVVVIDPSPTEPQALPRAIAEILKSKSPYDRKFFVLWGTMNAMMAADGWSTFRNLKNCPRCKEGDPWAAGIIAKGKAFSYFAGSLIEGFGMYIAGQMRVSDNPVLRKLWVFIPVTITAAHGFAMWGNLTLN